MSAKEHILTLDNGTQSVRALLFDLQGNLVDKSQVHLEPYYSKHPGWAEQDPLYYWQSLCEACQSLWEKTSVEKESIIGAALTTQRATMVNVDRDGQPLRPAIVWLDQRRTEGLKPIGGALGLALKLLRVSGSLAQFQARAQSNWIATNQPEVWEKTHKFLLLSGFLTHRLVGRFVDSVGSQVGYIPFVYK
jgi:sugar (pentulose or hexulose) kinase